MHVDLSEQNSQVDVGSEGLDVAAQGGNGGGTARAGEEDNLLVGA